MKYIKTFEKREISEDERKLNNLARRLEYNLNKFFKPDKNNYEYVYVNGYHHNMSNSDYVTISIQIPKGSNEFVIFLQKFHELKGKYFITYNLSKEKAEELLLSLKRELPERVMEIDMKKYNL